MMLLYDNSYITTSLLMVCYNLDDVYQAVFSRDIFRKIMVFV